MTTLQQPPAGQSLGLLIRTLGYAHSGIKYKYVLEQLLDGSDFSAAHMALYVLCNYWDLTTQYIPQIISFLRGEKGYIEYFVCPIAGTYLASHTEPELLDAMIQLAESNKGILEVQDAYEALYTALHVAPDDMEMNDDTLADQDVLASSRSPDWQDVPTYAITVSDQKVLAKAKERLHREKNGSG